MMHDAEDIARTESVFREVNEAIATTAIALSASRARA
jgi:hypothetical protein